MKLITYSSNNSGGYWWLEDEHWKALEKAGWKVDWYGQQTEGIAAKLTKEDRFLGALASHAEKEFNSLDEAILEFESITGQDTNAEGCECCGQPHNFYEKEVKNEHI